MTAPLRAALIGFSGYGRTHYDLIQKMVQQGLMQLKAAVIINPDEVPDIVRACHEQGCTVYPTADSMWAAEQGRLDLVAIPAGIASHAPMSIAAMRVGAHVLVEKPVAGTVAEVDAIAEAARRYQRRVFVGFQDMYREDLHEIKGDLTMLANILQILRGQPALHCDLTIARVHTETIERIHRNHAIRDFDPVRVKRLQVNGQEHLVVEGLAEQLLALHETGELLREVE
jgi:hypothetical protein